MDDAARFRAIFEATFSRVRRYVHHCGVTGGRADDIVAETYLVAWRRLHDVPADDPLPWLLVVARNLLLNQRRGDRRHLDAAKCPGTLRDSQACERAAELRCVEVALPPPRSCQERLAKGEVEVKAGER